MYSDKILEIFKNPRNAGGLQGANGVGKAETSNSSDIIKLYIKVNEDGVVTESKFKTFGCVASMVCSSVITEIVVDKTIEELTELAENDILDVIGEMPEEKTYAVSLTLEALNNALQDYYKRKEKEEKKQSEN